MNIITSAGILSLLLLNALAIAAVIQQQSLAQQEKESAQNFERMKRALASPKDSVHLMHQRRDPLLPDTALPASQSVSPLNTYTPSIIQNYAYPGYANYSPVRAPNGGYYILASGTGYNYPVTPSNTVNNVYFPYSNTAQVNPSMNVNPPNPLGTVYQPIASAEPLPVASQITQPEPLPVIPISDDLSSFPPPPVPSSSNLAEEKDDANKSTKVKDIKKKVKNTGDDEDENEPDEIDAEDLRE